MAVSVVMTVMVDSLVRVPLVVMVAREQPHNGEMYVGALVVSYRLSDTRPCVRMGEAHPLQENRRDQE
jgi:hypothetical protein